ncbi:HlyD family secretion protein [Megamonas hypermegale]|uniref:HlyD family secretion protein n=1 Tax=Megamonas hypermegale TaxID=158847 RepID=UPI0026F15B83|nr:efflux RND transporter periplasmic adaptor subunit [Megamonas hypermegale]
METDITEKIKPVIRYSLPLILVIAAVLVFGIFKWNEAKSVLDIPDAKLTSSVVHVSSQSDGTLTEILVNDGDKVEAGQVIAKVKVITTPQQIEALQKACDEAQANYDNLEQQIKNSVTSQTVVSAAPSAGDIAAAQARVDAAAAQAQKMSKLYSIGAVSATQYTEAQSEYSAAQAALSAASAPRQVTQEVSSAPSKELSEALASAQVQLEQAQAALKQAQSDENYADITAPVSGIVYLTDFKQGDSLKENDVFLNIGNTKNLWVEAPLTEEQYNKVHPGQFVNYTVDDLNLTGTVLEVTHTDDSDNSLITAARISFPDDMIDKVTPGSTVQAKITLDK